MLNIKEEGQVIGKRLKLMVRISWSLAREFYLVSCIGIFKTQAKQQEDIQTAQGQEQSNRRGN
jgi:hypothetical protein